MKRIKLTQGKVALVDDEWYEYLNQWKWHVRQSGRNFYAARNHVLNGKWQTIFIHRLVTDCPRGMVIDHINGNGLDDKLVNLYVCTQKENQLNRKNLNSTNTSGTNGLHWHIRDKKWYGQVNRGDRGIYLGSFLIKEKAIQRLEIFNKFGL